MAWCEDSEPPGLTVGYDRSVPSLVSIARYVRTAPTTAIGVIALCAGLRRVQIRVVDGVLEAHGPALAWMLRNLTLVPGGAAAMTLGHVVIARDAASLESTRTHERVHVRQCEVWGPLFVPAYLVASLLAVARGGHVYRDNPFEVEAYDRDRRSVGSEKRKAES